LTGCDISGSNGGWSMKTMKGVVSEAGAYLEKIKEEPVEEGKYLLHVQFIVLGGRPCNMSHIVTSHSTRPIQSRQGNICIWYVLGLWC